MKFKTVEEAKWFFHKQYCESGSVDPVAYEVMNVLPSIKTLEEVNKFLKALGHEVETWL